MERETCESLDAATAKVKVRWRKKVHMFGRRQTTIVVSITREIVPVGLDLKRLTLWVNNAQSLGVYRTYTLAMALSLHLSINARESAHPQSSRSGNSGYIEYKFTMLHHMAKGCSNNKGITFPYHHMYRQWLGRRAQVHHKEPPQQKASQEL